MAAKIQWVSFVGENCEFRVSVVIQFICENQPGIGSRHSGVPVQLQLLPHVKIVSTRVLMFAYFKRADSILPKLEGPLSLAVPVSTITAANKEVKQVLDHPAPQVERTLLTSKWGSTTTSLPERRRR